MYGQKLFRLTNIDPDDISDVFVKIEKSFGFRFGKDDLAHVATFGEFCDIVLSRINLKPLGDCTTQQAFYKIRFAITNTGLSGGNIITPDSELEQLFPKKGRRRKISQISKESRITLKMLRPGRRIINILILTLITSLILSFINWKIGLIGITTSIVGFFIADLLGKEFAFKTVGEVATKIARDKYIASRRDPKTVNHREVVDKIREFFIQDFGVAPSSLTKEATFFI